MIITGARDMAVRFLATMTVAITMSMTSDQFASAGPAVASGPRKVIVASAISGFELFGLPLAARIGVLSNFVAAAAAESRQKYGRGLDLMIFPEGAVAKGGDRPRESSVSLDEIAPAFAALAKEFHSYLVVPAILSEAGGKISNAAVLFDRRGGVVGIYRKYHLAARLGSDVPENGITPGDTFPVFDCDFGKLGIQICWDMSYSDGWAALKKQGAEIVALPTASPQTIRPAAYALFNRYYVVNATPRDNATVFDPRGKAVAQVTKTGSTLVYQIDLSYRILSWSPQLDNGAIFKSKYGDRCGFLYDEREDCGVFWSNDPATPIDAMVRELKLETADEQVARTRALEQKARGDTL